MIEAAVVSALEEFESDLAGEQLVFAALARRHARLVDLAWKADDVSAVIRGSSQLRELIDLLPIRGTVPAPREGVDDDGGSPRAAVLELLERPAGVGDEA